MGDVGFSVQKVVEANEGKQVVGCEGRRPGSPGSHAGVGITAVLEDITIHE